MGPTEIDSNNTMKDEIIFIRNDIILVVFIINNEFEESTPKVGRMDFCFTTSIFPPKYISRN